MRYHHILSITNNLKKVSPISLRNEYNDSMNFSAYNYRPNYLLKLCKSAYFITQCFVIVASAAPLFPANRVTTWSPGIPGGIPQIDSPIINVVTAFGTKNDSSADVSDDIQAALDSLQSTGGVVYLPSGKYRIDKQLLFNGNNTVLRGAGTQTKLYLGFAGHSLFIGMYGRGTWQKLLATTKGSAEVVVSDGTVFKVGAFAEIEQANDSTLMYTDPAWNVDWADSMVGQLFKVFSVNGNRVTFTTPLHYQVRDDLFPQIRPQKFRTFVGIENLFLEKSVAEGHTIHIKNAAYCWVRRVESNFTRKAHVETETALGCTFTANYFHHALSYGGGGSGYGTSLHTHSTDCLVENNIFHHLRHAMIIQNGATGNVFGYNFSNDPVQGISDAYPHNETWDPPDISFHGHYAQYNLAEGNIVTEVGISDYWGPMGPGNTFFRNDVCGKDGIVLHDHSNAQNVVGNVSAGWEDDGTSTNLLFHGNAINNASPQWDSTIDTHTLPASLYRTAKPSFWTDAISWPGTGSDIAQPGTNPAQKRWENGNYFSATTSPRRSAKTLLPAGKSLFTIRQRGALLQITSEQLMLLSLIDCNGRLLVCRPIQRGNTILTLPSVAGVFVALGRTPEGIATRRTILCRW